MDEYGCDEPWFLFPAAFQAYVTNLKCMLTEVTPYEETANICPQPGGCCLLQLQLLQAPGRLVTLMLVWLFSLCRVCDLTSRCPSVHKFSSYPSNHTHCVIYINTMCLCNESHHSVQVNISEVPLNHAKLLGCVGGRGWLWLLLLVQKCHIASFSILHTRTHR